MTTIEMPSALQTILAGADLTSGIPDVMEFVLSPNYLARPNLFPRQATLLKLIFCQEELFTDYDYKVIEEWSSGFVIPPEDRLKTGEAVHYEGNNGVAPDVLDRMRLMRAQGRGWFRENLPAIGRRGGKGYIGGLSGAYVIWYYHQLGDPQRHFGVDRDKRLGMYVFAGKREQAKANQWRDIVNVILGAPCFTKSISRSQGEILTLFAPNDGLKADRQKERGVKTEMDPASFEIVPKESTLMAGRGPALFAIYFDEMAHVVASGANRSAEEVWGAATPALDQFATDAFIYCGSSTWQMMGQFYTECQQALEIEPDGQGGWRPVYPEKLFIQLTSWDIYKDWNIAHTIPLVPEEYAEACYVGLTHDVRGRPLEEPKPRNAFFYDDAGEVRTFGRIKRPIQAYDDEMKKLERANPETFRVERRCLDPDTRVLKADLTWVPIKDLVVGDEVISVDEYPESGKERKMRTATVTASWKEKAPAYRLTFADGSSVVCSGNHRWLSAPASSPGSFRWRSLFAEPNKPGPRRIIREGDTIRFLVDPWEPDASWRSGYLAGVYDGEGTAVCRHRSEWRLDFTQNPGEVLDATLRYLRELDFKPQHVKTGGRKAQCYKVVGFSEVLRFIGITGAHKLRRQAIPALWEGRGLPRFNGVSSVKTIVSIEELPEQDLIDIETTTGTFVAEGLVSHNSHWATALNAYLNPAFVDRMWEPWNGQIISQQTKGILNRTYVAHGDPSKSGANFGWAIAHSEGPDDDGLYHVVFDVVHAWKPSDYEEGVIDYIAVVKDLCSYIDDFIPSQVSFDQFNSAPLMAQLKQHVGKRQFPRRVDVFERTATRQVNWAMAECFKTALGLGLIHAPFFELADLELKFLQDLGGRVDHPDSGPVQTKDVADAMMNVVWGLIGEQMAAFIKDLLSSAEVRGALPAFDATPSSKEAQNEAVMEALSSFGRARGMRPDQPRGGNYQGFRSTPKRRT